MWTQRSRPTPAPRPFSDDPDMDLGRDTVTGQDHRGRPLTTTACERQALTGLCKNLRMRADMQPLDNAQSTDAEFVELVEVSRCSRTPRRVRIVLALKDGELSVNTLADQVGKTPAAVCPGQLHCRQSASSVAHRIDTCQYRRMSNLLAMPPLEVVSCSPSLSRVPLTPTQAEQIAPMLKALADPVRLRLVSIVASHSGGEACVCDLTDAFDLSQPTISHHLKVLHDAGLLDRTKRRTWVYYSVRAEALAGLAALISSPTN